MKSFSRNKNRVKSNRKIMSIYFLNLQIHGFFSFWVTKLKQKILHISISGLIDDKDCIQKEKLCKIRVLFKPEVPQKQQFATLPKNFGSVREKKNRSVNRVVLSRVADRAGKGRIAQSLLSSCSRLAQQRVQKKNENSHKINFFYESLKFLLNKKSKRTPKSSKVSSPDLRRHPPF